MRPISDRRRPDRLVTSDRRHHGRVQLDVLMNRFVDGHPYMCRMTNISRTGARLEPLLEPKASLGPKFMGLQFQLPGQEEVLTASGETMALEDGRGVSVRFSNLPPQSAWAIEAFLKAA
jgi:hypothetical protein